MHIPSDVSELTPDWFSAALGEPVSAVEVLDAHSGTTGRARVRLTSGGLPETLFVKLQPFTPEQRGFLRQVGLGVAEARLYAKLGSELPVRIPRVWHAAADAADGSFVMVLEDLVASGCRFPHPDDADIVDVARSAVAELAVLHASYQGRELPWLATPEGMRRKPGDPKTAARRTHFVRLALDRFGEDLGPEFRRVAQLYIERSDDIIGLFGEGDLTLIHGDTHSGNLFVDDGRTGFYDWAVVGRGPGMRDVAYFLCNSLPTEVRRSEQYGLLDRYRAALAANDVALDERTALEQYRLFSLYSWIAAVSTAAMGSQWQPFEIAYAAMVLTTSAIEDLGVVELLEQRLP